MSIPYQFNTEQFINVPSGSNLGWLYPSTSVNSYQYTQKQGNNSVYFGISSMNAYYAKQSQAQTESVDNTLMRQSDPRMPLFNERKSTTSFGKGS